MTSGLNTEFKIPPLDGSLCVPEMYDWHYTHNKTHSVFRYAGDGIVHRISYGEFVPALHRAAHIISEQIGVNPAGDRNNYPVVAVLSAAAP
ncbi:hypothetical protein C0995_009385 [Termitomyces sp. Mi166|nr:hypothetical protein C0995_009385 [Termitomyces sp. Mi166\